MSSIIIVDNASLNAVQIKKYFNDNINIIFLDDNVGIAKAQNIGMDWSINNEATHVLLFDQDTIPPSQFVESLLKDESELLANNEPVAAIGPSFFDGRTMKEYPVALINGFSLKKIYPSNSSSPISVSFIIASGTLIRVDVIKEVGYMMETLFIDYVDIEWCLRAINLGYKIYVTPSIKIVHEIGDSRKVVFKKDFSVHSPIRNYYISRNGFIISRLKHIPVKYKIRTLTYTVIRNIINSSVGGDVYKNIRFAIFGIYHGVVNRTGKLNN